MSIIKPFRGYLPPAELAKQISSPPYDVLSSDEAKKIAKNNKQSFLRVIKPEIDFKSNEILNSKKIHENGKNNLNELINNNQLIKDDCSSFYVYRIIMNGHTQTGIVAGASISEYDQNLIKKHEYTRPDKEDDRTIHINTLNANTGPVFLTFKNKNGFNSLIDDLTKNKPDISFIADDNTCHIIWKIPLSDDIDKIKKYFFNISCLYIADGHHRAASASRIQKNRFNNNDNHTGNEAYNYFLSVIFPHNEMKILDYNRIIKDLNGLTEKEFINSLKENFIINPISKRKPPKMARNFSMLLNNNWYNLEAKEKISSQDQVNKLDASILQNYILEPILGIDDPRTNNRIDFVGGIRGLNELEDRCNKGFTIAFALYPVCIEDLLSVADAEKVMPPKSTWFEPKLRSGLIIRDLN